MGNSVCPVSNNSVPLTRAIPFETIIGKLAKIFLPKGGDGSSGKFCVGDKLFEPLGSGSLDGGFRQKGIRTIPRCRNVDNPDWVQLRNEITEGCLGLERKTQRLSTNKSSSLVSLME